MSYADQQMSGNRITALIIVALIHIALGYALVTGLAYEGFKQALKKVQAIDIKEDKVKPPPPPPPKNAPPPPPIVAPPPPINVAPVEAPHVETVREVPHLEIQKAAPRYQPKAPVPKTPANTWVNDDDYPPRAARESRGGVTGFRLSVGPDGRVTGCEITAPSGSPDLDQATCNYAPRRARFAPATDDNGQPTSGSYTGRVRWVPPTE